MDYFDHAVDLARAADQDIRERNMRNGCETRMNDADCEKACEGGRTLTYENGSGEFAECVSCGTRVRWDLVDDPFFGFQNCPGGAARALAGIEPSKRA